MALNEAQVITDLLGLCRSEIEKRYGEQALDVNFQRFSTPYPEVA